MHLPRNQRSHTGRNTASDCSTCQEKTRVQLIQYAAATCWLYCFLSSILLSSLRHFQSELHSVVPDTIYVLLHIFFFFIFWKIMHELIVQQNFFKKFVEHFSHSCKKWRVTVKSARTLPDHSSHQDGVQGRGWLTGCLVSRSTWRQEDASPGPNSEFIESSNNTPPPL